MPVIGVLDGGDPGRFLIVARLTPAVRAAKDATQTIPIVMAPPAGAPLETGLIASLSRPGANITGLSITSVEASGNRLQLMREMLPSLRRVAMLANAADPISVSLITEAERAARDLRLQSTRSWSMGAGYRGGMRCNG
jgi:putative ABC transport system substrate-binding protein